MIRESANCAARHLEQALSVLREFRDWQEAFQDLDFKSLMATERIAATNIEQGSTEVANAITDTS